MHLIEGSTVGYARVQMLLPEREAYRFAARYLVIIIGCRATKRNAAADIGSLTGIYRW